MAPGPLLATIVDTVTGPDGQGLAGCSDDQLMGIIAAARRQQARDEWTSMAAIAGYATRHAGSRPADEFAPVELSYGGLTCECDLAPWWMTQHTWPVWLPGNSVQLVGAWTDPAADRRGYAGPGSRRGRTTATSVAAKSSPMHSTGCPVRSASAYVKQSPKFSPAG